MEPDRIEAWVLGTHPLISLIKAGFKNIAVMQLIVKLAKKQRLAIPRQVVWKMGSIFTELPKLGMLFKGAPIPDARFMKRVMADAGEVTDPDQVTDDPAPWVLALALHRQAEGDLVCVVSEDFVDRDGLSVASACGRLGLDWRRTREFLEHFGIPIKPEPKKREDG